MADNVDAARALPFGPLNSRGLPPAAPWEERCGRVLLALALLWFVLAAGWEIAGPIGAGHVQISAQRGIVADNMWTWGVIAPFRDYFLAEPDAIHAYRNHPWGVFWANAVFFKVFGSSDLTVRLLPVLMGVATPALLYGLARALWSPIAAGLTAATYVVIPITVAYIQVNTLESGVIFGCSLTAWASVRYFQTRRRRFLVASLIGVGWTANADWFAYVFLAFVLGGLFCTQQTPMRRFFGSLDRRSFSRWWFGAVVIAVVTLSGYVLALYASDSFERVLGQAKFRSGSGGKSLWETLAYRREWLELSFTPLAIIAGLISVPVCVVRLFWFRRPMELIPLAFLVAAAVDYFGFTQGASVHIFWPLPFAPFVALGVGVIAFTSVSVAIRARALLRRRHALAMAHPTDSTLIAACGIAFLLIPLLMIPDAARGLVGSRNTGGRFNEHGRLIHQDVDKIAALRWLSQSVPEDAAFAVHRSFNPSWSQGWALHRPARAIGNSGLWLRQGKQRYLLADSRFLSAPEQRALAYRASVTAIGPFWLADREAEHRPIESHALSRREPTSTEWYFLQGNDPIYSVKDDPYGQWELRHHLHQRPNPLPQAPPASREEKRIAHNIAVDSADSASADAYLRELEAGSHLPEEKEFVGGHRLVSARVEEGVAPRLELLFFAAGPTGRDVQYKIRSKVVSPAFFSLVPPSKRRNAVGMPWRIPSSMWKRGFVYSSESEIRPRPGEEAWEGVWEYPRGSSGGNARHTRTELLHRN